MLKEKSLNIILVILYDEAGFEGEKSAIIDSAIEGLQPDFHEVAGAGSLNLALKNTKKNAKKLDLFLEEIRRLTAQDARFSGLRVGKQAGLCPCTVGPLGKIISIPIGEMAYHAMREVAAAAV